ncbi:squalene/phytoene synthase family protein [Streptomyces chartreusis]|uniref:squalene/phytoene synthase family protein n=1 Tax=Streptomyces chartreusis TaxID=1969 RepID=UPI003828FC3F
MSDIHAALTALESTSRTFFIPISLLPAGLQEAVMSAYLGMRAIDEIEDHPELAEAVKQDLLHEISRLLQADAPRAGIDTLLGREPRLADVTLHLNDWMDLAPRSIAPRVRDAIAVMADRMGLWARRRWAVHTRTDLDWYTYSVAGTVGLLLSDLWAWYDGTPTTRAEAVAFGRGLQATNIFLNRDDDLNRGVDFYPTGWTGEDMHHYALDHLRLAETYTQSLPEGPARNFCSLVLALAQEGLHAWADGRRKLTRADVSAVLHTSRAH